MTGHSIFSKWRTRTNPTCRTCRATATASLAVSKSPSAIYRKALAINPDFVRAREYLGEGYAVCGPPRSRPHGSWPKSKNAVA